MKPTWWPLKPLLPYLRKKFGFERLPDYDAVLWAKVKRVADNKVQSISNNLIQGSDIDLRTVATAQKNSAIIDPGTQIKIFQKRYIRNRKARRHHHSLQSTLRYPHAAGKGFGGFL